MNRPSETSNLIAEACDPAKCPSAPAGGRHWDLNLMFFVKRLIAFINTFGYGRVLRSRKMRLIWFLDINFVSKIRLGEFLIEKINLLKA